jgi:aryl-alcohol dehydrogenase-like predicted oxidoreductase
MADVFGACRKQGVSLVNRSTYLQGLLLMDATEASRKVPASGPWVWLLARIVKETGIDAKELALRYVLGSDAVDCTLIGVDGVHQFDENLEILGKGPLDAEVVQLLEETFEQVTDAVANPSLWPKPETSGAAASVQAVPSR